MTPRDDAAGEMKQAEVVGGLLAPADQDGAEAVQPGVCPLHHPTPGFDLSLALGHDLLAAGAQVQGEAELFGQGARLVVVVALVQAEVLRLIRWRLRSIPGSACGPRRTSRSASPSAHSTGSRCAARRR